MNEKNFDVTPVENAQKELKPKDRTRKTISIIAAVAFVISAAILISALPSYISQKNYDRAVNFEQEYEFEKAIEYYGKVKESDAANYSAAVSKITNLTAAVENNKTVANALKAALETESINIKSISEAENLLLSDDKSSVCFTVGGVGYYVSPEKPKESHYYTTRQDALSGLFVTEYAPSATYTGWLSTITDNLKKETSNYMFKLLCDKGFGSDGVIIKLAEKYISFEAETEK